MTNPLAFPHRLLHVGINFRSGNPSPAKFQAFETLFNNATHWYRYGPGLWLLWTGGTPETWMPHLKPLLDQNDYALIIEVNIKSYSGWLPQGAWDWLKSFSG